MSNQSNSSRAGMSYIDTGWKAAFASAYAMLTILIIGGNILVVAAFCISAKLRTKTNYFVVSLACTDLIVGIVSVPMWIYFVISGDFNNPSYTYYMSLDMVSGVASIMHLTSISVERCYAIVSPLKHRNLRIAYIILAICASWTMGLFSALFIVYVPWKDIHLLNTFLFFFVPFVLIVAAYILIYITARKSIRGHQKENLKQETTLRSRSSYKELHIAYTVAMVTGVFVVCWLPFFLLIFLYTFCPTCGILSDSRYVMGSKLLHYGNSGCNPIIYGARSKSFNSAFKQILRRLGCRKRRLYRDGTLGMGLMSSRSQGRTRGSMLADELTPV